MHGAGAPTPAFTRSASARMPTSSRQWSAQWQRALNANLPPTIRVMKSSHAASSFHARSAKAKVYRYFIRHGPILPPQEFGRVWHVPQALQLDVLRQALAHLVGQHDFGAFSAHRGKLSGDTIRTIQKVGLAHRGELLTLSFQGDGFLYKMVRMLRPPSFAWHKAEIPWRVSSRA